MSGVENGHGEADVTLVSEATAVDDEMFAALADEHRRFVLYALLQFGRLTLEELADIVAGWTSAAGWRAVTRDERKRVLLLLRHKHVPMLEEAGYVEYDEENDEFSLGALPASLYDLVTYARRHEAASVGEGGRRASTADDGSNSGDGNNGDKGAT